MTYIEPALPIFLVCASIGALRAWRHAGAGGRPWLLTIGVVGMWLISMNVGAWLLSRPLEIWYERVPAPRTSADAIVVLSGAVQPPSASRPYPMPGHDTYRRVQHAAWLFRNWKPVPILACGGGNQDPPHAEVMRRMLMAEGVPGDKIWTESQSTNTHGSAVLGAEILRAHRVSRVVVVTEASSMPRASWSFRRQGLDVVPAPIRFNRLNGSATDLLPGWGPLAANGETIHELLGLAWYKLRGRI